LILNLIANIIRHPLNRNNKTGSLLRFLRWQIGSILLPGPIVLPWVNNAKLIVARGEHGLTLNIYCGLQDFSEMAFCLHFLRPEDVFFDVGANFGSYTVLASAAVGARTSAFEPVSSSFAHLMQNIRINEIDSLVSAHNIGLAAEDTQLLFSTDQNCTNHVVHGAESNSSGAKLQTVKMADSFKDDKVPTLMKIDVEGFEMEVLKGAQAILNDSNLKAIVIELNGSGQKYGYADSDISAKLIEAGFAEYTYCPFTRNLKLAQGLPAGDNRIFVRDYDFVCQRLVDAPKFSIFGKEL